MVGAYREDLEPAVLRAEAAILGIVKQTVPSARLNRIGPIDTDGPAWSCWIFTDTDEQRDQLARISSLPRILDEAASQAGFAPDSSTFQSQETVDRDYEGSWFYAMG
jgi:hypothetical protein